MADTTAVIEMLKRLVAFDTVSRNSNLALIEDVKSLLGQHGIESRLVFNDEKTKANLLATIGPNIEGGIVLSGHTDVVPIDDQDWQTQPFSIVERDKKLYGRGTADMKSFLAIALAYLPEMRKAPLKKPIHLAFSYDEEVGCAGVPSLIAVLKKELPMPSAVIVGEPTDKLDVAMWSDGVFVVVYHKASSTDLARSGIFLELRNNDGALIAGPTRVSEPRAAVRDLAVVTWGSDSFAVVWGDQYSVFARRFTR